MMEIMELEDDEYLRLAGEALKLQWMESCEDVPRQAACAGQEWILTVTEVPRQAQR